MNKARQIFQFVRFFSALFQKPFLKSKALRLAVLLFLITNQTMIPLPMNANAGPGNWIKVNGENSLDLNEPFPSSNPSNHDYHFTTVKNSAGDLHYIFNSPVLGTVMGRFLSGGNTPSKRWELFGEGNWDNSAETIPHPITNGVARYFKPKLFPLPDNDEGFVGTSMVAARYATSGFDVHGFSTNIMFDGTQWKQWVENSNLYATHYMPPLVSSWDGASADFAFDPQARTGILISLNGFSSFAGIPVELTAVKYSHEDPAQKWCRWNRPDFQLGGDWGVDNIWPSTSDAAGVRTTRILNPNPSSGSGMAKPNIVYLGNGNYLATFFYYRNTSTAYYFSSARYVEGVPPVWQWWNGTNWSQGGTYSYQPVFSPIPYNYADAKLLSSGTGKAEGFFLVFTPSGSYYLTHVPYDETAGHNGWENPTQFDGIKSFSAAIDNAGTLWLFTSDGFDVHLRQKPAGGVWSAPQLIYDSVNQTPQGTKVLDANFVENGSEFIPICFISEQTAPDNDRIYAITAPEHAPYWSDEVPLSLNPPVWGGEILDTNKIAWQYQIRKSRPGQSYGGGTIGKLAMDQDGFLYSSISSLSSAYVVHANDQADFPDYHVWGGHWDYLYFPGDIAVDNLRGKVYITHYLAPGGAGGIDRYGRISIFDLNLRTTNLGYGETPPDWNQVYRPIYFGSQAWPGGVAVSETAGILYVTDSLESRILKYNLNNLDGGNRPTFLGTFGQEGVGNGQFKFPQGLSVGPDVDNDGNPIQVVYVADTENHRIQKFDAAGNFLSQWGVLGRNVQEFLYPFSVVADPTYNLVYVLDPQTWRVQVFDRQGNFLYSWRQWTHPDPNVRTDFSQSSGMTADGLGNIYIGVGDYFTTGTEAGHYFIAKFSIVNPGIDNDGNGIPDSLQDPAGECNDAAECSPQECQQAMCNNQQCVYTPLSDGTSCVDNDLCNGDETCQQGTCTPGTPLVIDDNNPCTSDSCDPILGVQHSNVSDGTSCVDNDLCNGDETCQQGTCTPGTPLVIDDNNPCTSDSCDPILGVQHSNVSDGTSCVDNDLCNGDETCQQGTCTPGTPLVIDDDNPCTSDSCDPILGVQHSNVSDGTSCVDNDLCNGDETCQQGTCTPGTPLTCDDNDLCNGSESCDSVNGCQPGIPLTCDDNDLCNGIESCNSAIGCVNGTPLTCDDNEWCNGVETCDSSSGCESGILPCGANGTCDETNDECLNGCAADPDPDGFCGDSNVCNGIETCNLTNGTCTPGTPLVIDDDNPCTSDSCDPILGVQHSNVSDGTSCVDNDLCNGDETCQQGTCTPGTPLVIDDNNPCTSDSCDPILGVQHSNVSDGTSCVDNDLCNGDETCQQGTCTPGTPLVIDDDNPCTSDSCDPILGVQHSNVSDGTSCVDNDLCNGDETCQQGTCTPGTPLTCDDGVWCDGDETCNPISGCEEGVLRCGANGTCDETNDECLNGCAADPDPDASCGDSNVCNGTETCNLTTSACEAGTSLVIDDSNPCTSDSCDPILGVQHSNVSDGTSCEDGDLCNGNETCQAGACSNGPPLSCDDQDPNTVDLCDSETGECSHSGGSESNSSGNNTPEPGNEESQNRNTDVPIIGGGGGVVVLGNQNSASQEIPQEATSFGSETSSPSVSSGASTNLPKLSFFKETFDKPSDKDSSAKGESFIWMNFGKNEPRDFSAKPAIQPEAEVVPVSKPENLVPIKSEIKEIIHTPAKPKPWYEGWVEKVKELFQWFKK